MRDASRTVEGMVRAATGRSVAANTALRVANHLIDYLYHHDPQSMAYVVRARSISEHAMARLVERAIAEEVGDE